MGLVTRKILIVEDEANIIDYMTLFCNADGFQVVSANDGLSALTQFQTEEPDFVLLDLMLPGLDGMEVCRRIRAISSNVPIIMVTARIEEVDKLLGLETGADDYLTKPFSPRELMARIRAILRRTERISSENAPLTSPPNHITLTVGRLVINRDARQVYYDKQLVNALTNKEYDLLLTLARVPGRVYSKTELEEVLYDCDSLVASRAIAVHVSNLRNKLPEPGIIETVYGIGYKLSLETL